MTAARIMAAGLCFTAAGFFGACKKAWPYVGNSCDRNSDCADDEGYINGLGCKRDWPDGYCTGLCDCDEHGYNVLWQFPDPDDASVSDLPYALCVPVVEPKGEVDILSLLRCKKKADCRDGYSCRFAPWHTGYCLPKGTTFPAMPHFDPCKARCVDLGSCLYSAKMALGPGDWPQSYLSYLSEDRRSGTCGQSCFDICPDEATLSEASNKFLTLDACMTANSSLDPCVAGAWCSYQLEDCYWSFWCGASRPRVDYTAACLGEQPSPMLAWRVIRAFRFFITGPCPSDAPCSTWLECSGYNAVKAYDDAHGG